MYSNSQPHKLLLGKQTFENWYTKVNTLKTICQSPTSQTHHAGLSPIEERPTTFSDTVLKQ